MLSAGSSSLPASTRARTGADAVTGGKVTEPDALGAIVTLRVSTTRPSTSRLTGRFVTSRRLRFERPAVIVTRSSPENCAR